MGCQKTLLIAALGTLVCGFVPPAFAQPPVSRDAQAEIRRLEAELEKARARTRELEARLKEAREKSAAAERRPAPPPPFMGRDFWGGRWGGWGMRGRDLPMERRDPPPPSWESLERRLDQIIREVEQLRRELRR